jgi:aryl carrier-like protein
VYVLPDRILRGALGALLLVGFVACTESVTGTLGCPQLCGDQSATLRDTTLSGVVTTDSVLTGYPEFGETRDFTLISQGDTADVRAVIRFDTLPNTFRHPNASVDSAVTRVDSARIFFVVDTTIGRPKAPVTIDAFDVDTTAADTLRSALVPLFRQDRLIGSRTFEVAEIRDTLPLPISNAVVLAKATAGARLRVGLRIRSTGTVRLRISGSAYSPRLTFRVTPDTLVHRDTVLLQSLTPTDDPIATVYAFYPIVVAGALPPPGAGVLAVGGVGGARTYLRFDIPPILLDSVQVVRASLLLNQLPSRVAASSSDTTALVVSPILAGEQITNVRTIINFAGSGSAVGLDSVRLVPKDAGLRSIELVNLFRAWRAVGSANSIRAIVLRAKQEAASTAELDFVSSEGAEALRPKLRITYVPRRGFGLP